MIINSIDMRFLLLAVVLITACSEEAPPEQYADTMSFELLDSTETGIGFVNAVTDRMDFNGLTYRNFYNGGGVSIGDINNDGLLDLYFTSNLGQNRLYLNEGEFKFKDITQQARVAGTRTWSTGSVMADVNGDGWLDIYVSNSGDVNGDNKTNELFINRGDLTFSEEAEKFGLNNQGYSTQATFFDYDLDGDLDCYLLNNSFKDPSKIELFRSMRDKDDPLGGDRLYRNDGTTFVDVTNDAGIYSSGIGFGLGASVGDLNQDMLPDIYVSNDFWERDYLYINQGDGTFSEELIDRIDYCSISSMGGDIADINNDGYPEIISTDMLAADNYRLKAMSAFDPYHLEDIKYRANYHFQIAQNCLHLNDGDGNFQEMAMLSGVGATDWSWGALLFDMDNDGWKDLFVSNGLQRDLMYLDFRDFLETRGVYEMMARGDALNYVELVHEMPSNPIANFAFLNQEGLDFSNQTVALGLGQPSFSNGSAYGDLDRDGDQDLVISNVNGPAFIYKNGAEKTGRRHLRVHLAGPEGNPFGIGAKVSIQTEQGLQVQENYTSRGFQSSVAPELLFGLGRDIEEITSISVEWPGGQSEERTQVAVGDPIEFSFDNASDGERFLQSKGGLFALREAAFQGNNRHLENQFSDFDFEVLQWSMLSTQGPRIVKGDVNGDQLEDLILLGAFDDPDKLFLQEPSGEFRNKPTQAFQLTRIFESTCGDLLDLDADGDLDLMIGSGGNESVRDGQLYTLRYYENDGAGNFTMDNTKVPTLVGNWSTLEAEDFDGDGDDDLFLGGRVVPGNYGLPPRSYILRNENGKYADVTPTSLAGGGMVTDGIWIDLDQDEDPDLVVVGEWMGILVFTNEEGTLLFDTELANSKGWWNRIEAGDLDRDGDLDLVVGNWGHNSKFQANVRQPLTLFVNDFDNNGKTEFILNWFAPLENRAYPFATLRELGRQLPPLRKEILSHEDYTQATYETLFPAAVRERSLKHTAHTLATSIVWNEQGKLVREELPRMAQLAPVYGIVVEDFNRDGNADIWLGGNMYDLKPQVGRQDANKGTVLLGRGGRYFEYASPSQTGMRLDGQVRDAQLIQRGNRQSLIIAKNNDEAVIYDIVAPTI